MLDVSVGRPWKRECYKINERKVNVIVGIVGGRSMIGSAGERGVVRTKFSGCGFRDDRIVLLG